MTEREPPESKDSPNDDDGIVYGDRSVHAAFQKQIAEMLEQADISEEERQQFLIALNCPCCGAGGLSFSFKIKSSDDDMPSF